MQDVYKVVMDVGQALTAGQQLITNTDSIQNALGKLAAQYQLLTSVSHKYDNTGQLVGATIKGITASGEKLTNTLSLVSVKTDAGTESMLKFSSASKSIIDPVANVSSVTNKFLTNTAKLPAFLSGIAGATDKQKLAYSDAIRSLSKYVEDNRIAGRQISEVWNSAGTIIRRSQTSVELERRLLKLKDIHAGIAASNAAANAAASAAAKKQADAAVAAANKLHASNVSAAAKLASFTAKQTAEVERQRNAVFKLADAYVIAAAKATKAQQEAAAKQLDIQRRTSLGTNASTFIGNTTNSATLRAATPSQAGQYTSALSSLERLAAKHRVATADIASMWANVSRGIVTHQVGAMAQVQTALERVKTAQDALGRSGQGMLVSWQSLFRFFEARVAYQFFSALTSNLASAVADARDFEQTLGRIRTLSSDTDNSVKSWSTSVKSLSNEFGSDALDVAKSYYAALSNQIGETTSDIEAFTRVTTQFAQVTGATSEQSNNLFSSAINAFKINAAASQDIAAKFFKAIDLGRITAQGLSGSFGRVSVAASTLGVSLEETLAGLSTLSRLGVTDADAMTQMLNLFNKLIKPSNELKGLFKEWGVASGEAAIQAFGFTGVIAKLSKELETNGISRLGELITDIRAFRGIIGLAGPNLKDFIRDLDLITNSATNYGTAVAYSFDSAGKTMQIELNKVRNMFLSAGQGANEAFALITKNVVSLTTILQVGFVAATTALATVLGFTLVSALGKARVAFLAWRASVIAATTVTRTLSLALGPILGIAALVGSVLVTSWLSAQQAIEDTVQKIKEASAAAQLADTRIAESAKRSLTSVQSQISRVSAERTADLTALISTHRKVIDSFAGGLKYAEEATLSAIDAKVNASKQRARELTDLLQDVISLDLESKAKLDESAFQHSLDKLSPKGQTDAIVAEMHRGQAELLSLANSSTQDGIVRIKALLANASKYVEQLHDIKQKADNDEIARKERILDLEQRIADSKADIATDTAKYAKQLELTGISQDIANDAVRKSIDLAEQKLRIDDATSKKKPNSNADAIKREQLANRALTADARERLQLLQSENTANNQANQLAKRQREVAQLEAKLQEERANANAGIPSSIIDAAAEQLSKTRESAKQVLIESLKEASNVERKLMRETELERFKVRQLYDRFAAFTGKDNLKLFADKDGLIDTKAAKAALTALAGDLEGVAAAYGADTLAAVKLITGEQALLNGLQAEIDLEAKHAKVNTQLKIESDLVSKIGTSYAGLGKSLEEYVKMVEASGVKVAQLTETIVSPGARLARNALEDGRFTDEEAKETLAKLRRDRDNFILSPTEESKEQVSELIAHIKLMVAQQGQVDRTRAKYVSLDAALKDMAVAQGNAASGFTDMADEADTSAARIVESVESMLRSLRAMRNVSGTSNTSVEGHATGGSVRSNTDSVLRSLTPGEFVVNRASASKFRPMLTAMNHNMSTGGTVSNNSSTTVGDINVHLQSTGRVTDDVQAIGRELKRSIRSGKLRF